MDQQPTKTAPAQGKPSGDSSLEAYQTVADTVGMVPSLRLKDNVVQALVVAGGGVLGALVGLIIHLIKKPDMPTWVLPVGIGIGGAILATFISGIVIMIQGWLRASKRKK